ncbi:MAG: hypothetical protein KBC41_00920 [Candidatus Pacebacteria bacterium]|nr:hypothetical protein [Candidatus Paceibacterota bacterium]MBP9866625.1 hypothetical protein [Candidatus Paceibacterota bacterium]
MKANRFKPSSREVSETLTALVVMGPWGIDGLYDDYFDDHDDEVAWELYYDRCIDCNGNGYLENYRECKTCKTSGSLLVALHLKDQTESPELYLGAKLRQVLQEKTDLRFAVDWWDSRPRLTWAVIPARYSWLNPDPISAPEKEYLEETCWQDGPLQTAY